MFDINELETKIKIFKHVPDCTKWYTSGESIYVWLDGLKKSGRLDVLRNISLTLNMFSTISQSQVTHCVEGHFPN